MAEGSDSARSNKKPLGLSLSISLPDDEEEKKVEKTGDKPAKATTSASATGDKPAAADSAPTASTGQKSARGETSGRTSARGEGGTSGATSGRRHSARGGGLSARGTATGKSVFCHEAVIKGNVIFGEGCIVHPGAQILAEGGDIIMGDFNIVEEYARIVNQPRKDQQGNVVKRTMRIGNYNSFEVGCLVESSEVGDMNEFGVKSSVSQGSQITQGCFINPMVQVPAKSKVPPHSVYIDIGVIAMDNQFREEAKKSHMKEISSILSESIPQHLKTQIKDANGNWQPIEAQPKQSTRPGSKAGTTSARGTGGTSARNGNTSSRTGATSNRTRAPTGTSGVAKATPTPKQ